MNILAFDTCFDGCSVCVAERRGDTVVPLGFLMERFETGHAERLIPMIGEAMQQARLSFDHLGRIAVTVGPGTFTGTRIGVAAAR
ncbi:MAG: tRNA (adenosine(37)-N6)-threonylcarbamoyltransferase complex dimerization subunit type 1 TsaB, partial [Hyphomicrobium sp.]|nr:tRNA (adenosine(37)-N6)-threonylcarbamoyltransferase complex dimerization subunit type 1 TsaB [Hyphomicrobium sp.]